MPCCTFLVVVVSVVWILWFNFLFGKHFLEVKVGTFIVADLETRWSFLFPFLVKQVHPDDSSDRAVKECVEARICLFPEYLQYGPYSVQYSRRLLAVAFYACSSICGKRAQATRTFGASDILGHDLKLAEPSAWSRPQLEVVCACY